jgi:anthraniloyl-CoA monooxygenase
MDMNKIICIGGGPAGLYFGILMKIQNPKLNITVFERNRPGDTFGWGVVLSDQTLQNLIAADPITGNEISLAFNHWEDIELFFKGRSVRSTGHGFCGIGRKQLLNILQKRCSDLGVNLIYETEVDDLEEVIASHSPDLVIACDGLNSKIRTRFSHSYKPNIDVRKCRFVWLGTKKVFDAFTFIFEKTEHGWFQAHAYKFNPDTSTFIVETPESVWKAHGLDEMTQEEGIKFCEKLFEKYLNGNKLISNATHLRGSAIWINFPRVICSSWVHWHSFNTKEFPIVLMGDSAHTAHFSIGSGTKLALEDAIDLAQTFKVHVKNSLAQVLQAYEDRRSVEVLKIQNSARNSTNWFENVDRYTHLDIQQFFYSLLTRSQRISHENLRLRDPKWLASYENWMQSTHSVNSKHRLYEKVDKDNNAEQIMPKLPMLLPFKIRSIELKNRVVVSPMATYSAKEGLVDDFHLVHLGARALGGAGLIMVEMTSPTPEGRITHGCPGLWNSEQMNAFKRITSFVHQQNAHIGIQLGHSGAKGSTQLGWQEIDEPIKGENWPLIAASALAYGPQNQVPKEMTAVDMQFIKSKFVDSTILAIQAGFDWLELHCAHGYLLSEFISPLTNHRTDEYGSSLENRCKFPLEVFKAMRDVWPVDLPMSVRISAHDWAPGGNTDDDAVVIAALFKQAGCDLIDVSSGQTTRNAKPVYGRMYQTPFSDRIRNEIRIATIAVGAISDADQVNSIIAAGRADLCAVARPHLADPAWTLHEVAKLGVREIDWPLPYLSGRDQLYRLQTTQK